MLQKCVRIHQKHYIIVGQIALKEIFLNSEFVFFFKILFILIINPFLNLNLRFEDKYPQKYFLFGLYPPFS